MYSSRSFAIGLIGIASCYLVVMICKAYRRMNDPEDGSYANDSASYYYDYGSSYDFQPYQSDGDACQDFPKLPRNQTIGSNSGSFIGENDSDIQGINEQRHVNASTGGVEFNNGTLIDYEIGRQDSHLHQ